MSRNAAGRLAVEGLYLLVWGAGVAFTLLFFRLRASSDPPDGEVPLAGLGGPVEVVVDSFGIPHVFATTREDLLRAQGFLHARDRLWQLELLRRIAAGRLAELFGEAALPADRLARTLDLWGAAGRLAEALDPGERALLEAYAAGVDAGAASLRGSPAPELLLLRFEPEPWTPRATMAIGMVMNLDLSDWSNDLGRHVARRTLPPEKLGHLHLPVPAWGPTILPGPVRVPAPEAAVPFLPPTPGSPAGGEAASGEAASADPGSPAGSRAAASRGGGGPGRAVGPAPPSRGRGGAWDPFEFLAAASTRSASNSWVLAPTRTADGRAILANDTHLGLRAPALWYLSALHAAPEGFHVAGLSLPGVPGVVIGHNRGVAWGLTNGMVDDMDYVVEETAPDGARYRLGEGWAELAVREETIAVRGRETPEVLAVRETVRGPLISDVLGGLGDDLAAVWVAARAVSGTIGILGMNAAETFEAFDRAITGFAAPHQNVVFASTDGRIGYRLGGTVPLRSGWDGTLPVPRGVVEANGLHRWPREEHPAGSDPAAGFYATANNLQAPGLHGVVGVDYPVPFRARRIVDRLAAERAWTVAATLDLQRDTRSLLADRAVERAVRAARAAGEESAAALLEAWDRRVTIDSRAAPLFYAWLYRLRELVAADEFAAAPEWAFYPLTGFLHTLETGDADPWVDDGRTPERETLDGLARRALGDALRRVEGRRWGELHTELNRHPLGDLPFLGRLVGFHVGPYPAPGGPHTVRPDDYERWTPLDSTSWNPPWSSDYGPSERFVATIGPDGIEGRFLLPTGQSGNPFSPHYRDMNERWRDDGPLIPVPLDEEAARRRGARVFRLVPSPPGGERP